MQEDNVAGRAESADELGDFRVEATADDVGMHCREWSSEGGYELVNGVHASAVNVQGV